MRKLLFVLLFTVSIICCSQLERVETAPTFEARNHTLSYSSAYELALTRTDLGSFIDIQPYVENHDTLFYIANYKNGWTLVSTDSRTTPFLANGHNNNSAFVSTNNIGHTQWMEDLISMLKELKADKKPTHSKLLNAKKVLNKTDTLDYGENRWVKVKVSSILSSYDSTKVGHLTQTHWGQESPWNQGLPYTNINGQEVRFPLGCTATAVGQLLYYFHYFLSKPNWLYHTIDFYFQPNYNNPPYYNIVVNRSGYSSNSARWDEMPTDSLGLNITYVRDFLLDIGERLNTYYYYGFSGTSLLNTGVFSPFNLSCTLDNFHTSSITTDLQNGIPVLMMGTSTSNIGHTWLIDGMVERHWTYTHSYLWLLESGDDPMIYDDNHSYYTEEEAFSLYPNLYDGMTTQENTVHSELYLLMNWGYDGAFNDVEYAAFGSHSWVVGNSVYAPGFYNKFIYYHFH